MLSPRASPPSPPPSFMGPSGMQLALRCFLLCQSAWRAAKGGSKATGPCSRLPLPQRGCGQEGRQAAGRALLPSPTATRSPAQTDVLEVSMQEGNSSIRRKTGSKAFRAFGSDCLLCPSTMLRISWLHLFWRNQALLQAILDCLSRSWINGLKQPLWSC